MLTFGQQPKRAADFFYALERVQNNNVNLIGRVFCAFNK